MPNQGKTNPSRKMRSIARKIHKTWSHKLFWAYVMIDLMVVVLAVAGFCYAAEQRTPLGFSSDTSKTFVLRDEAALDWLSEDMDSPREYVRAYTDTSRWQTAIHSVVYRFEDEAGAWHEAPMGEFLEVMFLMLRNLLICELVIWLVQRLFGGSSARRLVKPLTQISESAQQLSDSGPVEDHPFPGDHLHNLEDVEDAIESLEPNRHGVRLTTGNEELKGLEDAVNKLLDRMQAAYREQSRFVSDASHELRTPIAVIQGYASMLDRWGKTDESILDESIAAIKSESEHMKILVEQLLFLARGDSGRQNMRFEPFDLAENMQEVFEESEMIDQAHEWRIIPSEPITVMGDEAMVKQAIRILTDNAAKYTPPGGTITLRAFTTGGAAAFSVQDSGQGIAPDDIPHIFERFYRADRSRVNADKATDSDTSGTGLGLSIAEWIIKRHDGYFEVLSWPELGTRFTAYIPLQQ